jgi:hypothetical protein
MAAPTKPDEQKRTYRIPINCTRSEKERIEQNAQKAGLSVSDYLRSLGLKG